MMGPLLLRRCPGLLLAGLCLWLSQAVAQEADGQTVVEPIEDLQGRFHFTAEDLAAILAEHSLMLTRSQVTSVENAKGAAEEQAATYAEFATITEGAVISSAPQREDFQLDAIMFLGRDRWTFWLNGEAVTPESLPQGVAVLEVTPNRVQIAWTPDPTKPAATTSFTLEPGQTYLISSGMVLEADEAAALAASSDDAGAIDIEPLDAPSGEGASTPSDLALSPDQVDQLSQLQQALSVVSGNAEALGMSESELQQLQQSLAASGDAGALTAEQQEQLDRIMQATGTE